MDRDTSMMSTSSIFSQWYDESVLVTMLCTCTVYNSGAHHNGQWNNTAGLSK